MMSSLEIKNQSKIFKVSLGQGGEIEAYLDTPQLDRLFALVQCKV